MPNFRDNGYSSLALKRQRQAARAKSREASNCGTPNRSRAASRGSYRSNRPSVGNRSRNDSRCSYRSSRSTRTSQHNDHGKGNARPNTISRARSNGYLSAPVSAKTSGRGTRKRAPKDLPKGNSSHFLALGSSTDDVMAVLSGLGLSRQNSEKSLQDDNEDIPSIPKIRRKVTDNVASVVIMDSTQDLLYMDAVASDCRWKRPAPLRRQSSELSCLTVGDTPRQSALSETTDPDIQAVLDNLPILWQQNKDRRWSQCDDDEMFAPNASFKSLVHVAKWCRRIRSRSGPEDRRGSV